MSNFQSQASKEKFTKDLSELVNRIPEDKRRSAKYGMTVSFALGRMREDYRWVNLGSINNFEDCAEEAGFRVVYALKKDGSEHRSCRVIVPR